MRRRRGTDLVLSMTLAEIFLLLLMVGWYGMRLEAGPTGKELPPANELKKRLDKVSDELQKEKAARASVERQLAVQKQLVEWIASELGFPRVPATREEVEQWINEHDKRVKDTARRGKPVCASPNVLVGVRLDNGVQSFDVRRDFANDARQYRSGDRLVTSEEQQAFMSAVQDYYADQRAKKMDCSFDYVLMWRTDRDYRVGRDQFERYFYPAGQPQLR